MAMKSRGFRKKVEQLQKRRASMGEISTTDMRLRLKGIEADTIAAEERAEEVAEDGLDELLRMVDLESPKLVYNKMIVLRQASFAAFPADKRGWSGLKQLIEGSQNMNLNRMSVRWSLLVRHI